MSIRASALPSLPTRTVCRWNCTNGNGSREAHAQGEVTVAREEEKLKLGKGAAFVKSCLKRLPQEDETWEADFRALPKPIGHAAGQRPATTDRGGAQAPPLDFD